MHTIYSSFLTTCLRSLSHHQVFDIFYIHLYSPANIPTLASVYILGFFIQYGRIETQLGHDRSLQSPIQIIIIIIIIITGKGPRFEP
jgi:hypothetical protein